MNQYYLKQLFTEAAGKKGNGEKPTLSKEESKTLLESMLDTGRCLSGDSRMNLDVLFDALDTNDEDAIEWDEFVAAITGTKVVHDSEGNAIPPIKWELAKHQTIHPPSVH